MRLRSEIATHALLRSGRDSCALFTSGASYVLGAASETRLGHARRFLPRLQVLQGDLFLNPLRSTQGRRRIRDDDLAIA
jgi:hypothetical protein